MIEHDELNELWHWSHETNRRLDDLEERLDGLEAKLDALDAQLDGIGNWLGGLKEDATTIKDVCRDIYNQGARTEEILNQKLDGLLELADTIHILQKGHSQMLNRIPTNTAQKASLANALRILANQLEGIEPAKGKHLKPRKKGDQPHKD